MSQNLCRLCTLLVEDIYGPFLSKIFSTLTTFGRLPTNQIAQKCRLPLKHIRAGLAVLVQHRLVYHHTGSDGRANFEANLGSAYQSLRAGRLIQSVQRRLGLRAARIVQHLLLLGHSTVRQLENVVSNADLRRSSNVNGTEAEYDRNGVSLDDTPSAPALFHKSLQRLLDEGFLCEIRKVHFQTLSDARADAEKDLRAADQFSSAKGRKAQQEIEDKVDMEMAKRGRMATSQRIGNDLTFPQLKRTAEESGEEPSAVKRARLTDIEPEKQSGSAKIQRLQRHPFLPDDMILAVNMTQVVSTLRDERLLLDTAKSSGKLAAEVFSGVLRQIPSQFDPSNPLLTRSALLAPDREHEIDVTRLPLDVNAQDLYVLVDGSISFSYGKHVHSDLHNGVSPPFPNGYSNGSGGHEEDELVSKEAIERQMEILAECPSRFLSHSTDSGRWTVDVEHLKELIRTREVSELIFKRFGLIAQRIVRILTNRGRTDERWLQEIGLLSAKDLRQTLATLSSEGFLELQEVPREPQRQPSRTMFLWFYDAKRVEKILLEDVYRSMAKLLKRMRMERTLIQTTLDKVERSDVKGKEERLLGTDEMAVLKRWKRKECWLLTELDRLDRTVAILRDV